MTKYFQCSTCSNLLKFNASNYSKQLVICRKCTSEIEVRPYKNGTTRMKNLSLKEFVKALNDKVRNSH